MNFQKHIALASTLLAAAFAIQTETHAQTVVRSGVHNLSYGNQWMGGSYAASAYVLAQRVSAGGSNPFSTIDLGYASLGSNATIKFLLRTSPLANHQISAQAQSGTPISHNGRFDLVVKGLTERAQRFSTAGVSNGLSFYRTFNLFPADVASSLSVGGFPVTVRGNVSAGVEATATVEMVGTGFARIGGVGRSWGYGRVTAQSGLPGASASIELSSTFANTRVAPFVRADGRGFFNGGPGYPEVVGVVQLSIQPIAMKLKVIVSFLLRFSTTLVDWSSGLVSRLNILS